MKYVDCKKYAQEILDKVKEAPRKRKLAIITVGEDEASKSYVKGKIRDCEYCGIPVSHIKIEDSDRADVELLATVHKCNVDDEVAGIILQLPIPARLGNPEQYTNLIDRHKDVDGFRHDSPYKPCTPKGIVYVLEKELGDLTGKSALIIGRSNIVGRPLAKMLLDKNCTVTVAHSKTPLSVLHNLLLTSDIVVSAVGKEGLVNLKALNAEIVIDVGINRNAEGKLVGDCCNFEEYFRFFTGMKVTPVPGGVGLLTRAMLMQNVLEAS